MDDSTGQNTLTVFQQAGQADDYVEDAALPATVRTPVKPRPGRPRPQPRPAPRHPGHPAHTADPPQHPPTSTPHRPPAPSGSRPPSPHRRPQPSHRRPNPSRSRPGRSSTPPPPGHCSLPRPSHSTPPAPPEPAPGCAAPLARLGFPIGPSSTELAAWERSLERHRNETCVRQATWTRAVSVLIANPNGRHGQDPDRAAARRHPGCDPWWLRRRRRGRRRPRCSRLPC